MTPHHTNRLCNVNRDGIFIGWQHANKLMSEMAYPANVHEEVLKQLPHVVGGINLLHLHLCVHVAVVQEVDVGDLHLMEWGKKEINVYINSR